jgi:hypothetical protein
MLARAASSRLLEDNRSTAYFVTPVNSKRTGQPVLL